jgi:hypothetical protein
MVELEPGEWDERRVAIEDMDAGTDDPFPEFADEVRALMEHAGNEVGRPCVMKVTVEVIEGDISQPADSDASRRDL